MKKNSVLKTLIVTIALSCAIQPINMHAWRLTDSFANIKSLVSTCYQHKTATIVGVLASIGLVVSYFAWHKQKTK